MRSVTAYDSVQGIHFRHLARVARFLESSGSLLKTRVTAAINGLTIFVDLEEHQDLRFVAASTELRLVEQDAKATASGCFQRPQSGLARAFRWTRLGGRQAAINVRFHRRMPSR
jgi:hypothetical protein